MCKLYGVVFFSCLLLLGCTARHDIRVLSTSNPRAFPNRYLAKSITHDRGLREFIEKHGAPAAIKIEEEYADISRVFLYYPKKEQQYAAQVEGKRSRTWSILGPYEIPWTEFSLMLDALPEDAKQPVFIISGKKKTFPLGK